MQETPEMRVQSLVEENPLEKEMATHSSIFAWKIPWTEEPNGLQFMGSQWVRHAHNYLKVSLWNMFIIMTRSYPQITP